MGFLQQRSSGGQRLNVTMDKRAMIHDTSSEGSQSDTNTLPYVAKVRFLQFNKYKKINTWYYMLSRNYRKEQKAKIVQQRNSKIN